MQHPREALATRVKPSIEAPWASNAPYTHREKVSLADIWLILLKHWVPSSLCAATIFSLVVLYSFLKKPVYESVAQIRVDASQQGGLGLEDLVAQKFADSEAEGGRLQTEVEILRSRTVSMQVIKNLGLAKKTEFAGKLASEISTADPLQMSPQDREDLLRIFESNEKVAVLPKTRILELRFHSTDPQLATDTVNGILDAYIQRNFQSKHQGAMQVAGWLEKQLEELKADAARAQQRLAEFQEKHNILGTDENNNIVVDRLRQLNEQLATAEADRIVKEARYRLASSGDPELVAAVVPSTTLQVLRTHEADLKARFTQLDAKYGGGYPESERGQDATGAVGRGDRQRGPQRRRAT